MRKPFTYGIYSLPLMNDTIVGQFLYYSPACTIELIDKYVWLEKISQCTHDFSQVIQPSWTRSLPDDFREARSERKYWAITMPFRSPVSSWDISYEIVWRLPVHVRKICLRFVLSYVIRRNNGSWREKTSEITNYSESCLPWTLFVSIFEMLAFISVRNGLRCARFQKGGI